MILPRSHAIATHADGFPSLRIIQLVKQQDETIAGDTPDDP
jgi:hypothetical protein